MSSFEYIQQWITEPNRQVAQHAFTDSEERKTAYLIEEFFIDKAKVREAIDNLVYAINSPDNNNKIYVPVVLAKIRKIRRELGLTDTELRT